MLDTKNTIHGKKETSLTSLDDGRTPDPRFFCTLASQFQKTVLQIIGFAWKVQKVIANDDKVFNPQHVQLTAPLSLTLFVEKA